LIFDQYRVIRIFDTGAVLGLISTLSACKKTPRQCFFAGANKGELRFAKR